MAKKQMKLNDDLTLMILSSQNVTIAKDLCDKCVGENLYSEAFLMSIIGDENYLFYLLQDGDTAIGYFYCFLSDSKKAVEILKLDKMQSERLFSEKDLRVGVFQSIGLLPNTRHHGTAILLIQFFEKILFDKFNVDLVTVPAWKQDKRIPAQMPLLKCEFEYFTDVEKLWYECDDLICPYCKQQKCVCDAAIFMKRRQVI